MEQDQRRPQSMKISTSGRSLAKAKKVSQSAVDLYATQDRQRQPPPIRRPMKMLDKKSSKNLLESARASSRPQTALEVKTTIKEEEEEEEEEEVEQEKKKKPTPRGNTLESLMTKKRSPARKSSSRKSGGIPQSPGVKMHMNFAEQAMAAVKKRKSKRFTTPKKKKNVTVVEPTVRGPPVVPVSSRPPVVPVSNKTEESPKRKTPKIPKRTSSRRLLNRVEKPKEKKLDQVSISSNQLGLFVVPNVHDGKEFVQIVRNCVSDFSIIEIFSPTQYTTHRYVQRTNDRVFKSVIVCTRSEARLRWTL